MPSSKEYYYKYLKKYSKKNKIKSFYKKSYLIAPYNILFLSLPFLFSFVIYISFESKIFDNFKKNESENLNFQFQKKKYLNNNNESKLVNNLYSEKFTDIHNDDLHNNKHLNELRYLGQKIKNSNSYEVSFNEKEIKSDIVLPDWKNKYSKKKREFIEVLLPLIVFENQEITYARNRIIEIRNLLMKDKTLKTKDILYLDNISKKYLVDFNERHKIDIIDDLLIKVDIIPASIVLAQAANESGWGSSRFAREYNALFGQYTYDENNGIIPFEREEGKKHLIRNFNSIDKSVEAYFININSHYSYNEFRKSRQKNKNNSSLIQSLIINLEVYAADENYVNIINSIIQTNNLTLFDDKKFSFINS